MSGAARAAGLAVALAALVEDGGRVALAKPAAKAADPCASDPAATGPGTLDPFRPPAPKALELNAAGLVPYRQGKWEEARAQYRAALAADPEFLAPQLNIASSFVRQERFAEATAEVVSLLSRAYVPWAREIREAADLGALKTRPEMKEIDRAMAASAARWGEGLDASVLFVARPRPPLHLPDGPGVFILNPRQEVWAYSPRTRRYRQLTAEDGHVIALAAAGNRVIYVTADKLVRGAKAGEVALRDVTIHVLAPATMAAEASAPVEGDVETLSVVQHGAELRFWIWGNRLRGYYGLDGSSGLVGRPVPRATPPPLVVLTGRGVEAVRERPIGGRCGLVARQEGEPAHPRLTVGITKRSAITLATGDAGGLGGLPIP
ncbi:MAG TPA: hypothetical protein VHL80_21185 [Polyangia bacterium]|nr:hypothetical protein [Polyangia bacterium]